MDARKQRGLELARTGRITHQGNLWEVPSQSTAGTYLVEQGPEPTCTCPDFELHQRKCKHAWAVEFTILKVTAPDGTVTETKTVRVTYRQDWPAYNAAQTHESNHVPELLAALCSGIVEPPRTRGRPRLPLRDTVAAAVLKVYGTMSARRATGDVRLAEADGHLGCAPHFNTVLRTLENPWLTPLLKEMIEESAAPLKAVETDFAVDSSGFTTCTYVRWFDAKYGREMKQHQWLKAHLMVGVKTNVVTSVEVTDGSANDSPMLPALVTKTGKRFEMAEVSADKGYTSHANLEAIAKAGAKPYIPFKVNTTGEGPDLWRKLWHFYQFNRPKFLVHYHKRSNVETTFSMIKRKFGASVRAKGRVAQENEILCKILCHNLCCLVSSIYELGIEPIFGAEFQVAPQFKIAG